MTGNYSFGDKILFKSYEDDTVRKAVVFKSMDKTCFILVEDIGLSSISYDRIVPSDGFEEIPEGKDWKIYNWKNEED